MTLGLLGKHMLRSAAILGGFAILCAALVGLTYEGTAERIAANEREALLQSLHELVPANTLDNDIYNDTIAVQSKEWLGSKSPVTVYRARMKGKPVAAVIAAIAPDGYGGNIKLLVAVRYNGELAGVRVVAHNETPGLGDYIDTEHSNWILQFNGRSLTNPPEKLWQVKKDGGAFDSNTGATISPRAVVKAVYHALKYYNGHREQLFAATATQPEEKRHE